MRHHSEHLIIKVYSCQFVYIDMYIGTHTFNHLDQLYGTFNCQLIRQGLVSPTGIHGNFKMLT